MSFNIDLDAAMDAVRQSVDEKGRDHIAQPEYAGGCVYTTWTKDGNAPSCLVGHALVRLGLDADVFNELGINSDTDAERALEVLHLENYIGSVTGSATEFFIAVQTHQDKGNPWGEALNYALESIIALDK